MKMNHKLVLRLAIVAMGIAAPASAQMSLEDLLGGGGPKGERLEAMVEAASEHPLGSDQNPVRADMPRGQRAYLNRLRCADGNAPLYRRVGNMGVGAFGRIVDLYEVKCEGSEPSTVKITMDMYHPGYQEAQAVEGFTMEGEEPEPPSELEELPRVPAPEPEATVPAVDEMATDQQVTDQPATDEPATD